MTYNPKTVQVRLILDDEWYDDEGDLTEHGWAVLKEMVESVNGIWVGGEQ